MRRRVVVTGLGCVSPLGGVRDLWDGVCNARSGTGPMTRFDVASCHARAAGEVRDFDPTIWLPARDAAVTSRCVQMGLGAAHLAVEDAELVLERSDRTRIAVLAGTSIGSIAQAFQHHAIFLEKGIGRVHPLAPTQDYPGALSSEIAIRLGIRGPTMTVTTACTSGADAIGLALGLLRSGMVDVAIVGGSESPFTPVIYAAFDRLHLLARGEDYATACRPFCLGRDGIVLSEGAAMCVLETEEHAAARGARTLAEVAGFAATCDAYHQLMQLPNGEEAGRAMQLALADAAVSLDDVDYISAHGTGTVANDAIETQAIHRVFGARAPSIPMSALKAVTGHLMGACGALEFIAAVLTIRDGVIPPTAHLETPDPACDLDYVPLKARTAEVRTVLSNTFGFGARNASLVLRAI